MLWPMVTAGIYDCLDSDASERQCAGNTCDKRLLQTKEFEQTLHNKAITKQSHMLRTH